MDLRSISGEDDTSIDPLYELQKDFNYSGKADAFIILETGLGLWKCGGFCTHFEFSHGALKPNVGDALFSVNTARF